MGFDKASMLIEGTPSAARVASVMKAVVAAVVEVGPGISGLPSVREEPAGAGPLAAVCAGATWLRDNGHFSAALVLACDLPFVNQPVLRALAQWPGSSSVVPVIAGRLQPLCARWSAEDLTVAHRLFEDQGVRSMQALVERSLGVEFVDESRWPDPLAFADVDTPDDLERLGVTVSVGEHRETRKGRRGHVER